MIGDARHPMDPPGAAPPWLARGRCHALTPSRPFAALARVGTGWDVGEAAAARELRRLQLLNKVKDARLGELEKLVFIDG